MRSIRSSTVDPAGNVSIASLSGVKAPRLSRKLDPIRRTPSVSCITQSDAFRAKVFQDLTPAYLQRMGGAERSYFTVGFPRLIVSCNAVRSPPVFETGTTATGSTEKKTILLTWPTVGRKTVPSLK